jgi:hypothetical protein
MKVYVVLIALAAGLSSCYTHSNTPLSDARDTVPAGFPPIMAIEELSSTVFALTLESRIPHDKNVIYTPTLLFAWNEVKEHLPGSVLPSEESSADFLLLNKSNSHLTSLNKDEYTATIEIDKNKIDARAYFNMSIPFALVMQRIDSALLFINQPVASFGIQYYSDDLAGRVDILYYKDDDHFCLKLIPADYSQEIIFMKGLEHAGSLGEVVKQLNQQVNKGIEEYKNQALQWKKNFNDKDVLLIPVLQFNIAAHFQQLEGQTFKAGQTPFQITTAYQRTALLLNEYGGIVQSEADMWARAAIGDPQVELPHPKMLLFDKPFLLIIKKRDTTQPYFVMLVNNTELMIPSKKN